MSRTANRAPRRCQTRIEAIMALDAYVERRTREIGDAEI